MCEYLEERDSNRSGHQQAGEKSGHTSSGYYSTTDKSIRHSCCCGALQSITKGGKSVEGSGGTTANDLLHLCSPAECFCGDVEKCLKVSGDRPLLSAPFPFSVHQQQHQKRQTYGATSATSSSDNNNNTNGPLACTCPAKGYSNVGNCHRRHDGGYNLRSSSLKNNFGVGCRCALAAAATSSKTSDSAYNSGSSGSGTLALGYWANTSPPGGGFMLGSL